MESKHDLEKELERRYNLPRTYIDYVTPGGLVDLKIRDAFLAKELLEQNKERILKCLKDIQSEMTFEDFVEAITKGEKQAYEIKNIIQDTKENNENMTLESWVIYIDKIKRKVKTMKIIR